MKLIWFTSALALWVFAGLTVFLYLLNRRLIWVRDARFKLPVILAVFIILTGGPLLAGWRTGWSDWLVLPVGLLLLVGSGEVYRLLLRWIYRGSPAVLSEHVPVSLRRPLTTTDLGLAFYEVPVPGWSGELRLVHVSDFHVNERLPAAYFEQVVARTQALQGDVIVLTGDFVSHESNIPSLPALLNPLHARLGVYAVLGNHDYWAGGPAVADAVESAGITLIGDGCCPLQMNGSRVLVCGCEEPWGAGGLEPPHTEGVLRLALTHTPDNIYNLSKLGFHAVFAGHNHAGQLRLPGLGPIVVPSRYGRRFDHGHFVVHGTHLFVSAGVGAANPPIRLYCPPDIFVVTFRGCPDVPTD